MPIRPDAHDHEHHGHHHDIQRHKPQEPRYEQPCPVDLTPAQDMRREQEARDHEEEQDAQPPEMLVKMRGWGRPAPGFDVEQPDAGVVQKDGEPQHPPQAVDRRVATLAQGEFQQLGKDGRGRKRDKKGKDGRNRG